MEWVLKELGDGSLNHKKERDHINHKIEPHIIKYENKLIRKI